MLTKKDLQEIFENYNLDFSKYVNKKQIKIGHINNTYKLYFDLGSKMKRYLLQEINTNVFQNPVELMENIERTTSFLSEKVKDEKNAENRCLRVLKTKNNRSYMISSKNRFYRIYYFIENAKTYQKTSDLKLFYNASVISKTYYLILMLLLCMKRFLIFTILLTDLKPF